MAQPVDFDILRNLGLSLFRVDFYDCGVRLRHSVFVVIDSLRRGRLCIRDRSELRAL